MCETQRLKDVAGICEEISGSLHSNIIMAQKRSRSMKKENVFQLTLTAESVANCHTKIEIYSEWLAVLLQLFFKK